MEDNFYERLVKAHEAGPYALYNPDKPEYGEDVLQSFRDLDAAEQEKKEQSDIPWIQQLRYAGNRENAVGAFKNGLEKFLDIDSFKDDDTYDVFQDPEYKNKPEFLMRNYDVGSKAEADYRYKRDMNLGNQAMKYAGGDQAALAALTAISTSPETWLPVARPFSSLKYGRYTKADKALGNLAYFADNTMYNASAIYMVEKMKGYYDPNVAYDDVLETSLGFGALLSGFSRFNAKPHYTGMPLEGRIAANILNPARKELAEVRAITGKTDSTVGAKSEPFTRFEEEVAELELQRMFELVEAPVNLEKVGLTPLLRLQNDPTVTGKQFAERMVASGLKTKGVEENKRVRPVSVHTKVTRDYLSRMGKMSAGIRSRYLEYRGRQSLSPGRDAWGVMKLSAEDVFQSRVKKKELQHKSYHQFNEEVADYMRGGEPADDFVKMVGDEWQKEFNFILEEGNKTDIFTVSQRKRIEVYKKRIEDNNAEMSEVGITPHEQNRLAKANRTMTKKIKYLEDEIEAIRKEGPDLKGAKAYFPRYWRVDKILADVEGFEQRLMLALMKKNPELSSKAAMKMAKQARINITEGRPALAASQESLGSSPFRSAISRELDVDDLDVREFLENDAETVMRNYVQSMGTDIELTKEFGDFELTEVLDEVATEYDELMLKAKSWEDKTALEMQKKRAIADIEAMRDLMRGKYGISQDPYALTSRAVRTFKLLNVVTMLGGVAVSSLPDIGRTIMTEGIAAFYGKGLGALNSDMRAQIFKMSQEELMLAGEAWDMVTGWRAMQFADIGDSFGSKSILERKLSDASQVFFMLNGLNWWNSTAKSFANIMISHRILESSIKSADGTIDDVMHSKLKQSHIDDDMAYAISQMFDRHGDKIKLKNGQELYMPNTQAWLDDSIEVSAKNADGSTSTYKISGQDIVETFRAGVLDDVNRTIVTPVPGDKALWTSTEFGSLLAQFHSFAQASTSRVLLAGLQGQDANFAYGLLAMTAMGMGVSAFKDAQNGFHSDENVFEAIVKGVERSGIYGAFGSMHHILNTAMFNQVGLENLVGDVSLPTLNQYMSTFGGAPGGQIANAKDIVVDAFGGDVKGALRNLQDATPMGGLPYIPQVK